MGTRTTYPPAWRQAERRTSLPTLPPLPEQTTWDEGSVEEMAPAEGETPWLVDLTMEAPVRQVRQPGVKARPLTTAVLPAVDLEEVVPVTAQRATARRPRHLTQRLAEVGRVRPEVHIPTRATRGAAKDAARDGKRARAVKLPPIWMLANLVILLVATVAIVPKVVSVNAASACDWHTVVPGDTLGNLGWANHTNALAIARANHISDPNLIYVGQRICIPMTDWAAAPSAPAVPAVANPPAFSSASGVKAFVTMALPYAQQAHASTGWPVSVILAQWGLEHGWKMPDFDGYNWGNSGAYPGVATVPGSSAPGSPAAFAYGATPQLGLQIYLHCAHLSYYRYVAPAAASGGADAAARALGQSPWDAGHYTDRGDPGSSLINMMRVYNLYWYDTH